jgi:hypothetical protein
MSSEVLTAVNMKGILFWDITLRGPINIYQTSWNKMAFFISKLSSYLCLGLLSGPHTLDFPTKIVHAFLFEISWK